MNDALTALKEIIGFKMQIALLKELLEDAENPYLQEVNEEAQGISRSPNETRSFGKILDACKWGMLAEILARTAVHALKPITQETITKYASEYWLSKSPTMEEAVKYHDLIDEVGNVYEVKNWTVNQRHNNTIMFLHDDALSYNHSKYLLIFTADEFNLSLYDIIDVDAPPSKYQTIKIYSNYPTFTVGSKLFKFLQKYSKIPVEFYRGDVLFGKTTGEWVLKNSNPTRQIPSDGSYFIWSSEIAKIYHDEAKK